MPPQITGNPLFLMKWVRSGLVFLFLRYVRWEGERKKEREKERERERERKRERDVSGNVFGLTFFFFL